MFPSLVLGEYSLPGLSFSARCRAASEAGFAGISVFWWTLLAGRDEGRDDTWFRKEAEHWGLRIVQLEFAPLSIDPQFDDLVARMAGSAVSLGCECVHAVALDRHLTRDAVTRSLSTLAEACAARSLKAALEFVPFLSAVESLPAAVEVVRTVDNEALGLVLDALHFQRGGAQWDALDGLSIGEIVSVQINDGNRIAPTDDYAEEAGHGRLLPGAGEIDLARFLRTIRRAGFDGPLTVEATNTSLFEMSALDAATRLYESALGFGDIFGAS